MSFWNVTVGFIVVMTWGCACLEVTLRGFKNMGWGENGRLRFEVEKNERWGLDKGINLNGDKDDNVDIVKDLIRVFSTN